MNLPFIMITIPIFADQIRKYELADINNSRII